MKAGIDRIAVAAAAASVLAFGAGACGSGSSPSSSVDAAATQKQYEHDLADAPPPLAALVKQQNELLAGGGQAFDQRVRELKGYPIVVNKWASWCGPCRSEFPYFQSLAAKDGDRIAFIGVDSQDNDDAAKTFLSEFPVPYPSYSDSDADIADSLGVQVEFPSTIFIGSDGEVKYVSRGGYASEADLAADIDRYSN